MENRWSVQLKSLAMFRSKHDRLLRTSVKKSGHKKNIKVLSYLQRPATPACPVHHSAPAASPPTMFKAARLLFTSSRRRSSDLEANGADDFHKMRPSVTSSVLSGLSTPASSFMDLSYESPAACVRSRFVSSLDVTATDEALARAAAVVLFQSLAVHLISAPDAPLDGFDERLYIQKGVPSRAVEASETNMMVFFRQACRRAGFQVAIVVSVTVIFDRIVKVIAPHPRNWRILLLLSILLAQKVIDDVALGTNQMPELFWAATKDSVCQLALATRDVIRMEIDLLSKCKYDVAICSDAWDAAFDRVRGALA